RTCIPVLEKHRCHDRGAHREDGSGEIGNRSSPRGVNGGARAVPPFSFARNTPYQTQGAFSCFSAFSPPCVPAPSSAQPCIFLLGSTRRLWQPEASCRGGFSH